MKRLLVIFAITILSGCSLNKYCPDLNNSYQNSKKETFKFGKSTTKGPELQWSDNYFPETASIEKPVVTSTSLMVKKALAKIDTLEELQRYTNHFKQITEVNDTLPIPGSDTSNKEFNAEQQNLNQADNLASWSFWLAILVPILILIPGIRLLFIPAIIASIVTGTVSVEKYKAMGFKKGKFQAYFGRTLSIVWEVLLLIALIAYTVYVIRLEE